MKKSLIFSLLVLGITSLIGQVIILRELMVSFYGNEFFLGLVLAGWLAGTALGSLWLAQYLRRFVESLNLLLICHLLVSLFLPVLVFLIRLSRSWTEVAGQIPDLLPALAWAILLPAPLYLILGCQFVAGSQVFFRFSHSQDQSVSRAYLLESLGFIIAGLIFSFWLILFNVWLSIFILVFLNGLAIYFLSQQFKQNYLFFKIISLILIFVAAFLSWPSFSQFLNQVSLEWQFPHQKLVKTVNSYYGQLALTKINQSYNFYQSGLWLASSEPAGFNESLAHFSLLEHPQPKNVLLIGHGFAGLINEILKHQPEKIVYLELDREIVKLAQPYLLNDWQKALKAPQVKIIPVDGRYFIKTPHHFLEKSGGGQEKFDLIIINLTDPSTALLNRFYTQEFFEETKRRLQSSGILATYLSFSPNYQNQSLVRLNASIYQTLKRVFPQLMLLPEEERLLFLASSEDILIGQPEVLIQRWQQRDLETKFISPAYLEYLLNSERIKLVHQILESEETKTNQDTWPISYLYNLLFWLSSFHPSWAKYLSLFLKINFWWLVAVFLLFGLLMSLRVKRNRMSLRGASRASDEAIPENATGLLRSLRSLAMTNKMLWLAMAVGGFSLMASEILLIFAFQSFYGYLYYRLALLITAFMAGLAAGTWLGLRKISPAQILLRKTQAGRQKNIQLSSVAKLHLLIVIYLICLSLLFLAWPNLLAKINWLFSRDILFPFLAIIIGWLVGLEFVYANHLYSNPKSSYCSSDPTPILPRQNGGGGVENSNFSTRYTCSKNKLKTFRPGFIYSADLFGACLGALLTSLFLIPLFGLFQTLIILVLFNGLIVVLLEGRR